MLSKSFKLNEFNRALFLRRKKTKERFYNVIKDAIMAGYAELLITTPVDTGFMRSSVNYSFESNYKATLKVDAEYAVYVEYGGGSPRKEGTIPFFRPAIDKVERKIREGLKK